MWEKDGYLVLTLDEEGKITETDLHILIQSGKVSQSTILGLLDRLNRPRSGTW